MTLQVLYIFDPAVFPESPYYTKRTPVEIGREHTFGPWTVSLSHADQKSCMPVFIVANLRSFCFAIWWLERKALVVFSWVD
jgi:hypothetical protein